MMNFDNKHSITGGDFNLDWDKRSDSSYHCSSLLMLLEAWSDEHALSQLISTTTRHREVKRTSGVSNEKSCIDLILTNNSEKYTCGQFPGISNDHDIIESCVIVHSPPV